MTDRCPVCGKSDSELFMAGYEDDGSECWGGRAVSHLACVRQLQWMLEEMYCDWSQDEYQPDLNDYIGTLTNRYKRSKVEKNEF